MNATARFAQARREQLEQDFWRSEPGFRPGEQSLWNLVLKGGELPILHQEIAPWRSLFENARDILELGGGQGVGACMAKHVNPAARVIGSDISADAIASAGIWERVFGVELDHTLACRSYAVPLPSASIDLIFTFQAAHHFGDHAATLAEASRLLRPGGSLLYLYEPGCSHWTYRRALRRVMEGRPAVQEDLLVWTELRDLAAAAGLAFEWRPRLDLPKTGLTRAAYYAALRKVPALCRWLPVSMDFRFTKGLDTEGSDRAHHAARTALM